MRERAPKLSLLLIPLALLCVWLGFWQLQRMHAKQTLFDQFEQAPALKLGQAAQQDLAFAQVQTAGRYEPGWHLLLDNKILHGSTGVHVLSLFRPAQGLPILVNRGWLPLPPDRRHLPEFVTPTEVIDISGMLIASSGGGIRLGKTDDLADLQGPRLVTYLSIPDLEAAIGEAVSSRQILLDADQPWGFDGRNWQPAVMLPAQHRAYAVQWFALAVAAGIFWLAIVFRRAQVFSPHR